MSDQPPDPYDDPRSGIPTENETKRQPFEEERPDPDWGGHDPGEE